MKFIKLFAALNLYQLIQKLKIDSFLSLVIDSGCRFSYITLLLPGIKERIFNAKPVFSREQTDFSNTKMFGSYAHNG